MERLTDKNDIGSYYYPKCFEKCGGLGASGKCNNCEIMTSVCQKLGDYEDLEEQGRLIKLPCNRGDKIYFIKSAFSMAHFPIEATVTSICGVDCDNDVMYSSITEYNKIDRRFRSSDIGKTVFLTKSEAEEKLKELRGGENE